MGESGVIAGRKSTRLTPGEVRRARVEEERLGGVDEAYKSPLCEWLSASNAGRCSQEVRVIPCCLADSLTRARSMASNLRLTRTFSAKGSCSVLTRRPSLEEEPADFLPHVARFGALGRRTETVVASSVIRDDLALTKTLSSRPTPNREEDAAIAAASERFNFGPG